MRDVLRRMFLANQEAALAMWEWARFAVAIAAWPYIAIADIFQARKDRAWLARFEAARPWNDGTQ
jgi:hypothetical protein